MKSRILLLVVCSAMGCFSVRPGTPTSGISPPPKRIADDPPIALVSAQTPTPTADLSPDALQQAALARFASVHSYCARLRRRESINGQPKGEELILFKERKEPFSVHFKWIGPEANGREVMYVKGRFGDKLQILTAAGDVPFVPAGRRMALARDSLLVKAANPNHDITDAGLSFNLRDLGQLYAAARRADTGVAVRALGLVTRPESHKPMAGVEIIIPPGRDPDLPHGGTRQIFYSPENKLPVVYVCRNENGREQNYNAYDRLQLDLKLDNDDFDPDKLWGRIVEAVPVNKKN